MRPAVLMDLLDEVAKHLLGDLEVGDDAVLQRPDGLDRPGSPAQHPLGLDPHGVDLAAPRIDRHDRRLGEHDAPPTDVDERVRGPQVDRHVAATEAGEVAEDAHGYGLAGRLRLDSVPGRPRAGQCTDPPIDALSAQSACRQAKSAGNQPPGTAFGPGGGGIARQPWTDFHSSASIFSCGISSSPRGRAREAAAPGPVAGFFSCRSTFAGTNVNGWLLAGVAWKASYIGTATASWKPSGFMPMISCIVRMTLTKS